uniref:gliding motility-associated C-terminal domain-containing protein n=1 Tax=Flexithrix dorotheae TaxID=70993 RepID=UPI00036D8C98
VFTADTLISDATITRTFTTVGNYTAALRVTTDSGCTHLAIREYNVHPNPVAGIEVLNDCADSVFYFSGTFDFAPYSGDIATYEWDFEYNGTFDADTLRTSPDVGHVYATAGNYQAALWVTSDSGCSDLFVKDIIVHPNPDAEIVIQNQCADSVFTLDGSSSAGNIISYEWDYDYDGVFIADDSVMSPIITKVFDEIGTYTIALRVTTDSGCTNLDSMIYEVYPNPIPDFTASHTCHTFETTFSDISGVELDKDGNVVGSSSIVSRIWDFGDGNSFTGNANDTTVPHTYADAGTYQVTLTVETNEGCNHSITKDFTVHPQPVPEFTIEETCAANPVPITELSTIPAGFTGTDQIVAWNWDFGNGDVDSVQTPDYAYSVAGVYTVKLTVTTNNGCTEEITHDVTIYPAPATAFNTENVCVGTEARFLDTSTDFGRAIVKQEWDFQSDGIWDAEGPDVGFIYDRADTFNVTLRVTSITGCIGVTVQQIEIYELPEADAGKDQWVCEDESAELVASGGVSYFWDTGASTQKITVNPFESTTYTVTVQDEKGCIGLDSVVVNVIPEPMLVSDTTICTGDIAVLDGTVNGYPTKYLWSTNDRSSKIAVSEAGTYSLEAVINFRGKECIYNKTINVELAENPGVVLPTDTIYCLEDETLTLDAGEGDAYLWSDGDQTTRTVEIEREGIYHVLVTNGAGCTTKQSIKVIDKCPPRVFVPSGFTPNGDGLNDMFLVEGKHIVNFKIEIYNRWGEVIFIAVEPNNGWLGDYLGKDMPAGIYPYKVTYESELNPGKKIIQTGAVALIR